MHVEHKILYMAILLSVYVENFLTILISQLLWTWNWDDHIHLPEEYWGANLFTSMKTSPV